MHEFQVGSGRFGRPDVEDVWGEPGGTQSESSAAIGQVMKRRSAKLLYLYDFGDSWEHEIVVEDIARRPGRPVPALPRRTTCSATRGLRWGVGLCGVAAGARRSDA